VDSAQDSDFAPFFGDLSQSEKLSEIKLSLVRHYYANEQSCTLY